MSEVLIFGGTTEGRLLAEFCVREGIPAEISVATELGASLLSEIRTHTGRLDCAGMTELLREGNFCTVVDATHPYATEATRNIRAACETTGVRYLRLVRHASGIEGDTVRTLPELTAYLNRYEGVILSTLGSKALPALTQVQGFAERIWVRILPDEQSIADCIRMGFPEEHIIAGNPPFTAEQNSTHIRQTGAGLLVTKESGSIGGYPEKITAAKQCGIRVVTLLRTPEKGYALPEIIRLLQEGA